MRERERVVTTVRVQSDVAPSQRTENMGTVGENTSDAPEQRTRVAASRPRYFSTSQQRVPENFAFVLCVSKAVLNYYIYSALQIKYFSVRPAACRKCLRSYKRK